LQFSRISAKIAENARACNIAKGWRLMTDPKRLPRSFVLTAALLAGPALAFAAGIALVGRNIEGPAIALFFLGPLALVAWAGFAVAMALGARRRMAASTLLGAAFASLAFMAGVLGTFVPYVAGWGGHDLDLYGQDSGWRQWLWIMLTASGSWGALAGGGAGFLVWIFRPARSESA
jgi:hypothetical protein